MPSHAPLRPRRRAAVRWGLLGLVLAALLAALALAPRLTRPEQETAAADPEPEPTVLPTYGPSVPPVVRTGAKPRLADAPVAGHRLVATVRKKRGWTPGVRLHYQWLLDGRPVKGATKRAFVPTDEMVGRAVAVRVTATRPGYTPAAARSKARTVAPDNPLAGGPWAVYRGPQNGLYPAYQSATGENRRLLARIALQPRVTWFTNSNADIGADVRDYIAGQQAEYGDDVLIQLAFFREWPDGEAARGRPLSGAQQAAYRRAVDAVADAIGDARVAMVLEPDLGLNAVPNNPGDLRTADPAVRLGLVRYAAKVFSALPRTSVYLDASDSDWLATAKIVPVLEAAGIEYVRGFALGATHYSSVADNIDYGMAVLQALEADGISDKRFVIDTADNGRPFTWLQHRAEHPGADFDNAATCRSVSDTTCDTLGVPPTTDVADQPGLGLTEEQREDALRYVDAYLWFGRPWLIRQASPFSLTRALEVARSTPFQ